MSTSNDMNTAPSRLNHGFGKAEPGAIETYGEPDFQEQRDRPEMEPGRTPRPNGKRSLRDVRVAWYFRKHVVAFDHPHVLPRSRWSSGPATEMHCCSEDRPRTSASSKSSPGPGRRRPIRKRHGNQRLVAGPRPNRRRLPQGACGGGA